jgi:hypothetical protein
VGGGGVCSYLISIHVTNAFHFYSPFGSPTLTQVDIHEDGSSHRFPPKPNDKSFSNFSISSGAVLLLFALSMSFLLDFDDEFFSEFFTSTPT